MTPSKFTPGPWKAIPGEGEHKYMTTIQNRCGVGIARCVPCDSPLIAAAPCLYDALTRLLHPMADDSDIDHARALLARLEGEATQADDKPEYAAAKRPLGFPYVGQ